MIDMQTIFGINILFGSLEYYNTKRKQFINVTDRRNWTIHNSFWQTVESYIRFQQTIELRWQEEILDVCV